jgi:hypothetical protein
LTTAVGFVLEHHPAAARALAIGLNVGLFVVGFRILTVPAVPTRQLVPGAVLGGLGWSALQAFGGYLLIHQLRHASQVYGFFASVLGLVSWLQLSAQLPPHPRPHRSARGTAPGAVGHVLLAPVGDSAATGATHRRLGPG